MYKFFIVLLGVTVTCASGCHKIPLYRTPGLMRQKLVGGMESGRSEDKQYYGNVGFGTPPQPVIAVFDTGSADVWVLSNECNSSACKAHSRYNSWASFTLYSKYLIHVNITYDSVLVKGLLWTDFFTIADLNFKLTFTEAQEVTNALLFNMEYDAIVGMGFRSKSWRGLPTMFDNMLVATNITPIFSFYFNRDPTTTNGGLLTLAGLNQSHFLGDLHYVPLVGSSDWMFSIEHFHVGQSELSMDNSEALAATGHPYISAPTAIARKLYEALAATTTRYLNRLYRTVNCTTAANLPALIFTISGKQFTIESSDYIIRQELEESVTVCRVAVMPTTKPHWLLGQLFFGRYYSVYDIGQKRIGFAEAVHPFIG